MLNILDRYIGKTVINNIIITLLILVTLSSIIKFVEQLHKTLNSSYTILDAGYYTLLSIPKDIEIFFPMATLLGVLLGLGILTHNNEIMVMHASGYTRINIIQSVIKTAVPLILISIIINEFIAPKGEQSARNYRDKKLYKSTFVANHKKLWFKDLNSIVYIKNIKNINEISEINIYLFSNHRRLLSICYAKTGIWNKNKKIWELLEVKEYNFKNLRQINISHKIKIKWQTNLTPEKVNTLSIAVNPDSLSIRNLYIYNKYLKQSGQESKRYLLKMWYKIFQPLFILVMMLLALSFAFGPLYNLSVSARIISGMSFGFLSYVIDRILGELSLIYGIPPVLSAIMPSLIFLLISLLCLIKK
ncbi:LPS export ABC transporter permease LptG [Pantoea sp. Mhis]|uniref:LPS export ABC transporter permease LptG n=1 Tax=Pantoea sp. Mhis TaxID=2576759 RepID=UPI001356E940|nr:LPS export ABC transporter permease LptG [Pantoea sp. Mhis]MXP56460.1 LPS export ABC transporter permease LptG [Pantoea sp. Mhis]